MAEWHDSYDRLRAVIDSASLSWTAQKLVADLLDIVNQRLYAVEQDNKRLIADYRDATCRLASLEKRYSELLYRINDLTR